MILTHIINLSLSTGVFPTQWKNARIVAVHKSGSKSSLDNCMPISILPVLSKTIEKLVHQQLMKFLDENRFLSEFQFGFRWKMSTELAATLFLDNIRKNVDKGYMVGATFVNLSKAFDTINHPKLIAKPHSYGLNGIELEWFTNDLFNRNAQVSFKGSLSNPQKMKGGVPQGSSLGPLLFILFFNDIAYSTKGVGTIKYADDTVVYVAGKGIKEINAKLSNAMAELSAWFSENELILNLKKGKTEALLFGTAQRIRKCTEPLCILHENDQINITSTYEYLGVQLDSSLNLNSDFDAKDKKASGRLRLSAKIRNHLNIESAKAIYCSMVLPVLTYCGILNLKLNGTQENKQNSFHNRAMQLIARKRSCEVISPVNAIKRRACELVQNVLQNNVCHAFKPILYISRTLQEHKEP